MNTIRVIAFGLLLTATLHAGDPAPSPFHQSPRRQPAPIVPELQTDDFSCGYHAVAAIYRAHELDPDLARLRERLGTSIPAIPFIADSNGTLQPDLLRVLRQDGFFATATHPAEEDERRWLVEHLERGLYALALLKTDRPGGFHWIVLAGHDSGQVTIADSLKPAIHRRSLDELVNGPLLSIIILQPHQPAPGSPYHMLHARGFLQMLATFWAASSPAIRIFLLLIAALTAWLSTAMIRKLLGALRRRRTKHCPSP